jgi:CubicO group peptidase (beta-lactamase class C family)
VIGSYPAATELLGRALDARVFPAVVAEVGSSDGRLWCHARGTATFDGAVPVDEHTLFDLASLTKPIATAMLIMKLVDEHACHLDDRVEQWFAEWRGDDREQTTLQDLLEHASGLPPRLVDRPPEGRREFEHEICAVRLEYPRRRRSVYSDLGFILLGFLAADLGGLPLADQFDLMMSSLGPATPDDPALTFSLSPELRQQAAPTRPLPDDDRRGRLLLGEVHDNYAAALGGAAGHAGLFGNVAGVAHFARTVLHAARGHATASPPFTPTLLERMTTKSEVDGSSRALGWDTMLTTSSCGVRLSASAFGHVGFTGTSLWIDPEADRYYILLTNRACDGGSLEQMREVRRGFHDLVAP